VHAHLLNTDPPVHTRLRRLVGKAFTPRRVALLRPRAEEIAAGLLDEMEAAGGVTDLLDAYARPLPGVEGEVALGALLARFPRLSLAVPPEELRWKPRQPDERPGVPSRPARLTGQQNLSRPAEPQPSTDSFRFDVC